MHELLPRLGGWLWLAGWCGVLWLFVAPWSELGGVVSERWLWLVRVVLGIGLIAGGEVGALARRAARPGTGLCHARLLRRTHLAPAALVAIGLLVLRLLALHEAVGVLTTALLAYCAGFDLALAAWPLVLGQPYSFRGSIEAPEEESESDDDEAGWQDRPGSWTGRF
jgi:hypothetical protein